MNVVFRVDAGLHIGTGHVMRCLTLAQLALQQGARCHFVMSDCPGHLAHAVQALGHQVTLLATGSVPNENYCPHAKWLPRHWQEDATLTLAVVQAADCDWVVVDHYGLDAQWERVVAIDGVELLVVDDLADRHHVCDLLVDQTFGRDPETYRSWVPATCKILAGSRFAMLRQEFAARRQDAMARRAAFDRNAPRVLVTMGGVDASNIAGRVLKLLVDSSLPDTTRVTVLVGANNPWQDAVARFAMHARMTIEVRVDATDVARIMADSDIAVGAGGTTSWERCCLGLPSVLVVLADNQRFVAQSLGAAGATEVIGSIELLDDELAPSVQRLLDPSHYLNMSQAAAAIVDGQGANRVLQELMG